MKQLLPTDKPIERAIVVSVVKKGGDRIQAMEYLDELAFLAETAGADVIAKVYQERVRPDRATMIGKGKVAEIQEMIEQDDIQSVIFDDDLTPMQVRNLEQEWKIKVLDRSGIILDIFASRARSMEAKTQVELAQLQYLMPRLTRMWTHLSKQFGGIGTKGPGETQIETDRRLIRDRITKLKEKLRDIDMQRKQQRKGRDHMPRFALVGYTNAGKSTLMNMMTGADAYVEDKLFATLDTTVRQCELPNGQLMLLSDTVGFIRKLPTHLVASFRSTLAEAAEADALIHLVDCTHSSFKEHIQVVRDTLESLDIQDKTTLLVFNKIDQLQDTGFIRDLQVEFPGCICISAFKGLNIVSLLDRLQEIALASSTMLQFLLPYDAMKVLPKMYDAGEIAEREDTDDGIRLSVYVPAEKRDALLRIAGDYVIEP
ncbi:GTPase HflX [Chlorobiota bacterium]|nr:GTPase HflX [Chlorobiota bacterium]